MLHRFYQGDWPLSSISVLMKLCLPQTHVSILYISQSVIIFLYLLTIFNYFRGSHSNTEKLSIPN
jgi:hypothetical protein